MKIRSSKLEQKSIRKNYSSILRFFKLCDIGRQWVEIIKKMSDS